MSVQLLEQLTRQSERLTKDEQLALAMHLIERARQEMPALPNPQHRKWREIRGLFAYPLAGEDAQSWVTHTRREGDEGCE